MTTWDVPATMLSDRWLTIYWSIWHPNYVSILWWNHVLTVDSEFVIVVNFLEKRSIYSTRFSCRNCPLRFLFLIDISLPILQAGQISSTLHNHSKYTEDDDISYKYFQSWEVRRQRCKRMGSEINLSYVDYSIYSTRFFIIFFSWFHVSL